MEMSCNNLVQWATILSPIIAVALAWWTSRSGARDTAKMLSLSKKLMQIKLQLKMLELSKEAKEEHLQFENLQNKSKELKEYARTHMSVFNPAAMKKQEEDIKNLEEQTYQTFDQRALIAETMSDVMKLIKEVEKL